MSTDKIAIKHNKKLKLTNVLIRECQKNELNQTDKVLATIDQYVRNQGADMIGPIIFYNHAHINADGTMEHQQKILVQLNQIITEIDPIYQFKASLEVPNCLFARFCEREENLKFAFSKLELTAFEHDLLLKGDSYTLFLKEPIGNENVVADIFMEVESTMSHENL
ncbi:hypothetical protein H1Z61_13510 [Bacillus aquiflavi]|uniref:Uncharacterized protein n=1 Tax=Bacillus aquiflavi TaxID=2672567 RepID=A0A6B3W4R1_9BACI|nr:hypothetical protein [Bacillus aquiflavi]MBA4538124.1 hypothetical protein [Bacillus aquiflavi]NEY82444.1 hypothetical protein [Bacillus aquiflavi]UAC48584.1 hypothetical protein K6959_00840 [Bacillus aquiflavi]